MTVSFDIAVCSGRFQPGLQAHVLAIRQALDLAPQCVIIVENAGSAITPRHPFSARESARWLMHEFTAEERSRLHLTGLRVDYDAQRRIGTMKALARQAAAQTGSADHPLRCAIMLTDDETLPVPQGWTQVTPRHTIADESMRLRNALFGAPQPAEALTRYADALPAHTFAALRQWIDTPQFATLRAEWDLIRRERNEWADAPYPPVFVTVDVVVTCAEHVLLIRRGAAPGRGLLALPGGFIEQAETLVQAALRELREETRLSVDDDALLQCLRGSHVFDAPFRSQRGRVITHAFHFELPHTSLPEVNAADDAAEAMWVAIDELSSLESGFHDDHFLILDHFLEFADWSVPPFWA